MMKNGALNKDDVNKLDNNKLFLNDTNKSNYKCFGPSTVSIL